MMATVEQGSEYALPMPAVSYILLTYNQQHCAARALESALAQDYRPLQIIVSDDGSDDETVAVLQEVLDSRAHEGNCQLLAHAQNLGIGAHLNQAMEAARGELIVLAAGDDCSDHDRVSALVSAWLEDNRRSDAILSSARGVDAGGKPMGIIDYPLATEQAQGSALAAKWFPVLGATQAFTRRLWERFGPLRSDLMNEDIAISYRAALMGGLCKVPRPLVTYSLGTGVSRQAPDCTQSLLFEHNRVLYANQLAVFKQRLQDLSQMPDDPEACAAVRLRVKELEWLVALSSKAPVSWSAFRAVGRGGGSAVWALKQLLKYRLSPAYGFWLRRFA